MISFSTFGCEDSIPIVISYLSEMLVIHLKLPGINLAIIFSRMSTISMNHPFNTLAPILVSVAKFNFHTAMKMIIMKFSSCLSTTSKYPHTDSLKFTFAINIPFVASSFRQLDFTVFQSLRDGFEFCL